MKHLMKNGKSGPTAAPLAVVGTAVIATVAAAAAVAPAAAATANGTAGVLLQMLKVRVRMVLQHSAFMLGTLSCAAYQPEVCLIGVGRVADSPGPYKPQSFEAARDGIDLT
jgi:hypothetical protein